MSTEPPSPASPGLEQPLPLDAVRLVAAVASGVPEGETGRAVTSRPTATTPLEGLRRLVEAHLLDDVPLPGHGRTARRFGWLAQVAAADLSLGRLVEGHLDALAILAEAGRQARPGTYGVWAAERPGGALAAHAAPGPGGGWVVSGVKPYASGAGVLDHALVTAVTDDGPRLFEIDLVADLDTRDRPAPGTRPAAGGSGGTLVVAGSWPAVGMADSLSAAVCFDGVRVEEDAAVGPPGFYVERPGFWIGSAGVAACWYGGAAGVLEGLAATLRAADRSGTGRSPGPQQLAHLGAAAVRGTAMAAALTGAADEIDRDPRDRRGSARLRALALRHLVHDGCLEVLDRAGRAGRTSLLTGDRAVARRVADLPVYLSQHHPDDALVALGSAVLDGSAGR